MEGWIKLHRKIIGWEWYKDEHTFRVFIHLLLEANHENKNWKGVCVKRGELVTGRKELSVTTGISEQSIRTSLNRLKSTNEITIKPTNKFSIITINNYESYQMTEKESNQQINQQANQQSTNNQPTTNHKQELKKENNYVGEDDFDKYITPTLFETFWKMYPKKTDKGKTLTKWNQLCTKKDKRPVWKEIRLAIYKQIKSERWQNSKFIPHPATWLNQSRWLDDPKEMVTFEREENNKPKFIHDIDNLRYDLCEDGYYRHSVSGQKYIP